MYFRHQLVVREEQGGTYMVESCSGADSEPESRTGLNAEQVLALIDAPPPLKKLFWRDAADSDVVPPRWALTHLQGPDHCPKCQDTGVVAGEPCSHCQGPH